MGSKKNILLTDMEFTVLSYAQGNSISDVVVNARLRNYGHAIEITNKLISKKLLIDERTKRARILKVTPLGRKILNLYKSIYKELDGVKP